LHAVSRKEDHRKVIFNLQACTIAMLELKGANIKVIKTHKAQT